jgi:hypothetical protein
MFLLRVNPSDAVHAETFGVVPNCHVNSSGVRTVAVQAPQAPCGRQPALKVVKHVRVLDLAYANCVRNAAARRRGQAAAHRVQLGIIPL